MPGHSHDNTHASANTGNVLGDRACVRQSYLYRLHESGTGMKDVLGTGHLAWKTTQKEGVYDGHTVYDHNNPYNEKSALAPLRDRRGAGGPSGGNIISSDYPSDNYERFDSSKSAAPLTVRTHNDIGLARIPASEVNSMSHSFQKKMNKGRAAGGDTAGRRPSAENFKNLSPLSEKDRNKRSSLQQQQADPRRSGRGPSNPNPNAHLTAAERMKQGSTKRQQAPSSSLLTADLESMSTEELMRLSDGMDELKRLALKAETQSRLDHLKEELAALDQGSPIHRAINGAGGGAYGRRYAEEEEEESMPPRRLAPLPPMAPDVGARGRDREKDRDRGEGGYDSGAYYPPSGQGTLPSSSSRSLLPPSPSKGILKKPSPAPAQLLPKVRYQEDDEGEYEATAAAAAAARGLPPLRRGGAVGPTYASNAPTTSRRDEDWGGGGERVRDSRDQDRERNRDRDRGGQNRYGGGGEGDYEANRDDREAYLSPRSRRNERQQQTQKSSPEAKAAIDELRHSAGKFFNTDYHGKIASTNQLAFNNSNGNGKSKFDPNFVFGKKTARDSYEGEGGSSSAHSNGNGSGYGRSEEAESPSQRLHRSAPFAMEADLPSLSDRQGTNRPARDREREREREREVAMERQRQAPADARTSATEGRRNTRPW